MYNRNTQKQHWQFNLHKAMRDPDLIVFQDHLIVIIKDKYPKSQVHYLVLPKEIIPEIRCLTRSHLPLLRHMDYVIRSFFAGSKLKLWCGFHAKPTMMQLHLHVISDDLRGSGLKTAKHWNSYTTAFFISFTSVIDNLEAYGRVVLSSPDALEQLLRSPLKCHKCDHKPVNMPSLKVHLLTHIPIS